MNHETAAIAAAIAPMFYDGITDAMQWHAGLSAMQRAVGGASFHQITIDPTNGCVMDNVTSEIVSASQAELYEREFAMTDERMSVLLPMPTGHFMLDHEHFDARQISRSAVYSDFLHRNHMRHTMALPMSRLEHAHDYVGIMREKRDPAYGERERALLFLLMPEITRAARLRGSLLWLRSQLSLAHAMLDRLRQPIVLADAGGRIVHLNLRAEELLKTAGWIGTHHHRLRFIDPDVQAALISALTLACDPQRRCARVLRMSRHAPESIFACVLPLRANHPLADSAGQRPLAMLVFPSFSTAIAPAEGFATLSDALGITPTEAFLAHALAAGQTVKRFAIDQGCTLNTARSHLKNLLAKTGCRRQVELVQLVQALG